MNVLRDLHRIHQQLANLRERSEAGPKQIKTREAAIARMEADLNEQRNELKAGRVASDQKQLQLKSGEAKIADLRVKLNQASSNREYQALKDQIAADEMANSVLQDEILEGMEQLEVFAANIKAAEASLAKAKEELAKTVEAVRAQQEVLAADIARVEAELKETEVHLPADFRDAYNRIVKSKGADALAAVEGEVCLGCYQKVTANIRNNLLLNRVVVCLSCGRLLYLPEDRSPGQAR